MFIRAKRDYELKKAQYDTEVMRIEFKAELENLFPWLVLEKKKLYCNLYILTMFNNM